MEGVSHKFFPPQGGTRWVRNADMNKNLNYRAHYRGGIMSILGLEGLVFQAVITIKGVAEFEAGATGLEAVGRGDDFGAGLGADDGALNIVVAEVA